MANELQSFFAKATQKAVDDLITAVESLPEDKRASPGPCRSRR